MSLTIEDINKLEQENELISKQYNSLLKQYDELLRVAKENDDCNEFCISSLEKKYDKLHEFILWVLKQQYYILPQGLKNKCRKVLDDVASK